MAQPNPGARTAAEAVEQLIEKLARPTGAVLRKKRVKPTSAALEDYTRKVFALHCPFLLPAAMEALQRGIKNDQEWAVKTTLNLFFPSTKGQGGINIYNNNQAAAVTPLAQDTASSPETPIHHNRSMESIIRRSNAPKMLNVAPAEIECPTPLPLPIQSQIPDGHGTSE